LVPVPPTFVVNTPTADLDWCTAVHRDIKPSNIFFSDEGQPDQFGQVKLGDFGLATHALQDEISGNAGGSPSAVPSDPSMSFGLAEVHSVTGPSSFGGSDAGHSDIGAASFGNSTTGDSGSKSGGFLGTALYAAPEQKSRGTTAEKPADIFSLGMTLFELFAEFRTNMERVMAMSAL
jgi:serine/threonine protein kinase